jgi:hypothetical protein
VENSAAVFGNVGFELHPCLLGYDTSDFSSTYKLLVFKLGDDAYLLPDGLNGSAVLCRVDVVLVRKTQLFNTRIPLLHRHRTTR